MMTLYGTSRESEQAKEREAGGDRQVNREEPPRRDATQTASPKCRLVRWSANKNKHKQQGANNTDSFSVHRLVLHVDDRASNCSVSRSSSSSSNKWCVIINSLERTDWCHWIDSLCRRKRNE